MRHAASSFAVAAVAALSLAACGEGEKDEGATMLPGSDCLSCHAGGGEAPRFTAAGTVYGAGNAAAGAGLAGVTVTLTGASGSATVTTNSAGNFFTSATLGSSIDVELSASGVTVTRTNHLAGSTASCGECHASGLQAGIRVHLGPNPGTTAACAACHT